MNIRAVFGSFFSGRACGGNSGGGCPRGVGSGSAADGSAAFPASDACDGAASFTAAVAADGGGAVVAAFAGVGVGGWRVVSKSVSCIIPRSIESTPMSSL